MDVYDARQDSDKSMFRKLYEGLVGGLSKLLENTPRDEVATKTTVSGRIDNPRTNTAETIVRLIQNAFFQAILPGFVESSLACGAPDRGQPRVSLSGQRHRVGSAGPSWANFPPAPRSSRA
jgi:hypothetical protein